MASYGHNQVEDVRMEDCNHVRACKICGEIGHSSQEHQDGCPNCEKTHLPGECLTLRVTCFICEGMDHSPAQCSFFPAIQKANRQYQDNLLMVLKATSHPMEPWCSRCHNYGHHTERCPAHKVDEYQERRAQYRQKRQQAEDPEGRGPKPPKRNLPPLKTTPKAKAVRDIFAGKPCFQCGQEGHFYHGCPARLSGEPPAGTRRSRARARSRGCFRCKTEGHAIKDCPYRPSPVKLDVQVS